MHHRRRLEEVLTILEGRSMTAFEVASRMTWDLRYESWNDFPVAQRWFATGEAISHLRYLEEAGQVLRGTEDQLTRYCLKKC